MAHLGIFSLTPMQFSSSLLCVYLFQMRPNYGSSGFAGLIWARQSIGLYEQASLQRVEWRGSDSNLTLMGTHKGWNNE